MSGDGQIYLIRACGDMLAEKDGIRSKVDRDAKRAVVTHNLLKDGETGNTYIRPGLQWT